MKLIVAIIRDSDANAILDALIAKKYGATRASTTGVFWKQGNTTLLIGVEGDKVDDAIATIKSTAVTATIMWASSLLPRDGVAPPS